MIEAAVQVLGIFAKEPRPGQVKTRLAAETSPAWAAHMAAAFLSDTLKRFRTFPAQKRLLFHPAAASAYFEDLAGSDYALESQADGDLGVRLQAFFQGSLAAGGLRAVALGTDSPTLPPAFVSQAFAELAHADVVLGPATDGGYYLIGCSRYVPSLFVEVPWGGPRVLEETVARVADAGLRLALLRPWYDVDTLDDWRMLRGHVKALRRAAMDPCVPATEALLDK